VIFVSGLADVLLQTWFAGARLCKILLSLYEIHAICARLADESKLEKIIFPKANGANIVGTGRFIENQITTGRAGRRFMKLLDTRPYSADFNSRIQIFR
jgi:hypothetical protein